MRWKTINHWHQFTGDHLLDLKSHSERITKISPGFHGCWFHALCSLSLLSCHLRLICRDKGWMHLNHSLQGRPLWEYLLWLDDVPAKSCKQHSLVSYKNIMHCQLNYISETFQENQYPKTGRPSRQPQRFFDQMPAGLRRARAPEELRNPPEQRAAPMAWLITLFATCWSHVFPLLLQGAAFLKQLDLTFLIGTGFALSSLFLLFLFPNA